MSQPITMFPVSEAELQAAKEAYGEELRCGYVGELEVNGRTVKIEWYGIDPKAYQQDYRYHVAVGGLRVCANLEHFQKCGFDGYSDNPATLSNDVMPAITFDGKQLVWELPLVEGKEDFVGSLDISSYLKDHDGCESIKGKATPSTSWAAYGLVALAAIAALGLGYAYRTE